MEAEGEYQLLFVPVRESPYGTLALRTGHLPSGQRVALAFTSEASLLSVLGPCQPWIRLHEQAMREMLQPAAITHIRIDPFLRAVPSAADAAQPQRAQAAAVPSRPSAPKPPHRTPPARSAPLRCAGRAATGAVTTAQYHGTACVPSAAASAHARTRTSP